MREPATLDDWKVRLSTGIHIITDQLIPVGWQVYPSAPYIRPLVPWSVKSQGQEKPVGVLGCKSSAYGWEEREDLGHVLFFDIDTSYNFKYFSARIPSFLRKFNLSHMVVTALEDGGVPSGHHLWCCEIKPKTKWFPIFRKLKKLFGGDYEYSMEWILRLGSKGSKPSPKCYWLFLNPLMSPRPISDGHIALLVAYAELQEDIANSIFADNERVSTYVDMLTYKSWSY